MHLCAFHDGLDGVAGVLARDLGVGGAAVDPDTNRAPVVPGAADDEGHFGFHGLFLFVMMEVTGVVPDFVHMRGNLGCQPVVFLSVHGEVRCVVGLAADLGQRSGVFVAVHGDAHNASPGFGQRGNLAYGRVNVLGAGGAHTLNHDWGASSDFNMAYGYPSGVLGH